MNINYKLVGGIVGGVVAAGTGFGIKKFLNNRKAKQEAAAKQEAELAQKAADLDAELEKVRDLSDLMKASLAGSQPAPKSAEVQALELENLRLQTETQRKTLEMLNQFAAVAETAMGELQSELARKASRREAAATAAEAPKSKAARPTKKTAEVVAPPVVRREATSVTA